MIIGLSRKSQGKAPGEAEGAEEVEDEGLESEMSFSASVCRHLTSGDAISLVGKTLRRIDGLIVSNMMTLKVSLNFLPSSSFSRTVLV